MSCVTGDENIIPAFGYEGSAAKISCPYPEGYEDYEKYLCKDDCGSDEVLVTSQENKYKYSIYDDKRTRTFIVTISDLQFNDAGKYWCGVSRTGRDIYTEVKLEVGNDIWSKTPTKIQGNEEGSVSFKCRYETEPVNNLKYICRGNRLSTCLKQAIVTSDNTQNGRFTLMDDKNARAFTVTISSLNLGDSGWYLFGVQRNTGSDGFCAFELTVKEWCCVTSKYIKGIERRSVTWQCPYPHEHRNNRMFICKGNQRSNCRDIMGQSRFTVHSVYQSSFSVTITNLEARDAGTYWCRSNSEWSVGNYIQFHLSVEKEQMTQPITKNVLKDPPKRKQTEVYRVQTGTVATIITTSTTAVVAEKSHQDAALYGLLAVPPVLLTIVIIVLIKVCKKKCHKVKEAEVVKNVYKNEAGDSKDAMDGGDVYENHDDLIMHSKQRNCQEQSTPYSPDDPYYEDEFQYGNLSPNEDIYCNEFFYKTQR